MFSFKVVVGEHDTTNHYDGIRHSVSRVVEHPSYSHYNHPAFNYDFAIVTLKIPVILNPRTNAACLPTSSWNENFLSHNTFKVSGWGKTSRGRYPSVLHSINVPGVSSSQCKRLYGYSRITNAMLCAGDISGQGLDACKGDSGGKYK